MRTALGAHPPAWHETEFGVSRTAWHPKLIHSTRADPNIAKAVHRNPHHWTEGAEADWKVVTVIGFAADRICVEDQTTNRQGMARYLHSGLNTTTTAVIDPHINQRGQQK